MMDSAWNLFENMPATFQRKLFNKMKRFFREKETAKDPTSLTKEQFEAKVFRAEQQATEGKVRRFESVDDLDRHIRGL